MADEIFELKGKVSIDTSDLEKATKSIKKAVSSLEGGGKSSGITKDAKILNDTISNITESVKTSSKAYEGMVDGVKEVTRETQKANKELDKFQSKLSLAASRAFGGKTEQKSLDKQASLIAKMRTPKDILGDFTSKAQGYKNYQAFVSNIGKQSNFMNQHISSMAFSNGWKNEVLRYNTLKSWNDQYRADKDQERINRIQTEERLKQYKQNYRDAHMQNYMDMMYGIPQKGMPTYDYNSAFGDKLFHKATTPPTGITEKDLILTWGSPIDKFKAKNEELIKTLQKAKAKAKENTKEFSKFFGQLKRIATYRLIRSALKAIASTIREGTNNLYNYAKLTGNGNFAEIMDRVASTINYIKNSVGTVIAPIITALTPMFESLGDVIASVSEKLARFFALLTGQDSYYKAIKQAKEYIKVQRQILGFDELNVLNGNESDTSDAFDIKTTFGELSNFELVIQKLGLWFKEVIPENIDPLVVGAAIALAINGVAGIFSATGTLGGMDLALNALTMGLGFSDILPTGISATLVGLATFNAVKGAFGLFSLDGGIEAGITASITSVALLLTISSIKTLLNADKIKDSEFWKAWYTLAGTTGVFTGLIMKAFGGATLATAGLAAITVGAILTIAITQAKVEMQTNDSLNDQAREDAIKTILDGNSSATEVINAVNTMALLDETDGFWEKKQPKIPVQTRANGGVVNTGELFIAGEAGPELISNIGGRTQVFNDTQLIGELSVANEGVINAIIQAASQVVSSVNNIPQPNIRIGDRDIYNANIRGQRLVGKNLVEGV